MDGQNVFESRAMKILGAKFVGTGPRLGVFISHSRPDKEKARAVARALKASKVDYYFDDNDEELQLADERNDHLKVVRCIENGIEVCSHLLGIKWSSFDITLGFACVLYEFAHSFPPFCKFGTKRVCAIPAV